MASNKAAVLLKKCDHPFTIQDAKLPQPKADQVVIKVKAAAVNPVDTAIQKFGIILEEFPSILGFDMAGEIYSVGPAVKGLKVGDRVTAASNHQLTDKSASGSFQYYALTDEPLVAKIPDSISFTDAAVLPLAMATAAIGMFDKRTMRLNLPSINPKSTGETLLVWGGASSVGSCAIQLAIAGGYEVIATSSKKNFEYCKSLGAKAVFDYKSESVADEILAYLQNKKSAGVFMSVMDAPTTVKCVDIAAKADGLKRVGSVQPVNLTFPEDLNKEVEVTYNMGAWWWKDNEVGAAVFGDWVPQALANGALKCMPKARVAGRGLEGVQDAVDACAAGVSAEKIVVVFDH